MKPCYQSTPIKSPKEMDLQEMLREERRTSEKHKSNYQILKNEYTKLKDEYSSLQEEMKKTLEEAKIVNEKSLQMAEKANKMIQHQQNEIEELRKKLVYQSSGEEYRKLKEESKNNLQEWTNKLEEELDHYRQEYTRLHYESATLKTQLEYNEMEHKRTIEAMKIQYDTETSDLQSKVDELLLEKMRDDKQDGQHLRTLQKENSQLQLKIKGLLTELEELRKAREKAGFQADNVARLQTRQLAEHFINIRTLESEIKTYQIQKEAFEKELEAYSEANKTLSSELQMAKKETIIVKNQLEEAQQKFQMELTEVKMEYVRAKGKLEREKQQIAIELANLKVDFDTVKEELEHEKLLLIKSEEEWKRQINSLQYQMWERKQIFDKEKKQLEDKLRNFEQSKLEEVEELQYTIDTLKRNLSESDKNKTYLENEVVLLKSKLESAKLELSNVERLKEDYNILNKEVTILRQEKLDVQIRSDESQKQLQKQKQLTVDVSQKLEALKISLEKEKADERESLIKQKINMESEKQHFTHRVTELEKQLIETRMKTNTEMENLKQRKQQYGRLINKLRNKIELLEARIAELEMENEVLKKNIPLEIHIELKKQLSNLQRQYDLLVARNLAVSDVS